MLLLNLNINFANSIFIISSSFKADNQNTLNLLDGAMDERDTLLIYCFEVSQVYGIQLDKW